MTAPPTGSRAERALWRPGGAQPGARLVVFFPPAGADQRIAVPLLDGLAGLHVAVVRLPGRGVRSEEPDPRDVREVITEMADAVVEVGGPPPVLVGHSFGGLLAFAVAYALEQRGHRVGALVPVAATGPGAWEQVLERSKAEGEDPISHVERRVRRVLDLGALPDAVAGDDEQRALAVAQLRTDIAMSVHGMPGGQLRCPVAAVFARDDHLVGDDAAASWQQSTTGGFDAVTVPGDHFFYRSAPGGLVGRIRLLVDQLDGW